MKARFKKKLEISINSSFYIAIVSFYFAFVLNIPVVYKIFQLAHDNSWGFVISSPFMLFSCFLIIFTLFSFPFVLKTFTIALTLVSSITFYAALKYNVIFDYSMIENIFETHYGEATSYLNFSSVSYFIFFGILPSYFFYFIKIKKSSSIFKSIFIRLCNIVIATIILSTIVILYYKDYSIVGRNNRYLTKMINPAIVYYTVKYINSNYFPTPVEYQAIGQDAYLPPASNGKPNLVVLVVGETARAMNYYHNGYARNTTPYTSDLNLISFQDVTSCGTATAVSVPCMFSNMTRNNYNKSKAYNSDNALDVIHHAGANLVWIENDGGDKGIAKNIQRIDIDHKLFPDLCNDGACLDEVFLSILDQKIKQAHGNTLIALHIMGSHGPTYYKRYPKNRAVFLPDCPRSDIEKCSDEEIVNTYDNTIVYTDFILSEIINTLKSYQQQYNVALMYISDHGESLGENGLYLHGAPYAIAPQEQKKVPWLMWIPEQYAHQRNIDTACLSQQAKEGKYSHDNFFHTLIGFFGVTTEEKQEKLDITTTCHLP